jgi:hypothetical protein
MRIEELSCDVRAALLNDFRNRNLLPLRLIYPGKTVRSPNRGLRTSTGSLTELSNFVDPLAKRRNLNSFSKSIVLYPNTPSLMAIDYLR